MRIAFTFLCFLAFIGHESLAQAGATWDSAYPVSSYASAELNLREAPSTDGRILTVIPAGALVYRDACEGGWCPTKYQDDRGFVSERYLSNAPSSASSRRSTSSAGSGSSSSRRSVSVQCSGTTLKGARCRRMTKSGNGRCYQHGG